MSLPVDRTFEALPQVLPEMRNSLAQASVAFAVLLAGCGDGSVERVPVQKVRGRVLFEGKPAFGAFVVLHPTPLGSAGRPAARAYTDRNGNFELSTYEAGDGVAVGSYTVTIEWRELEKDGSDRRSGKNILPQSYCRPESSRLQVEVRPEVAELDEFKLP